MRKGFSLIELLIVIIIISIVYFLGFDGIGLEKKRPKALTPLTLKSTIIHSDIVTQDATFICTNACRSCYIRHGISGSFEAYEQGIDLKGVQAYTLDENEEPVPMDYGRYQDQKICLKIDFYRNGSSTPLILKNEGGVYFLPAFFGTPQKTDTLEEARDLWLKNSKLASSSGDFY